MSESGLAAGAFSKEFSVLASMHASAVFGLGDIGVLGFKSSTVEDVGIGGKGDAAFRLLLGAWRYPLGEVVPLHAC